MHLDVRGGHHKYLAHQSALLYVSAEAIRSDALALVLTRVFVGQRALSPFKFGPSFKKRLEEHFDDVSERTAIDRSPVSFSASPSDDAFPCRDCSSKRPPKESKERSCPLRSEFGCSRWCRMS